MCNDSSPLTVPLTSQFISHTFQIGLRSLRFQDIYSYFNPGRYPSIHLSTCLPSSQLFPQLKPPIMDSLPPTEANSQSSYADDVSFQNDLNEAIKLSLQDFRAEPAHPSQNTGSLYVNFNTNGSYFLVEGFSKGENDVFDPNQMLDIMLFYFKSFLEARKGSSVSSSYTRATSQYLSQNGQGAPQPYSANRKLLSDSLDLLFGKGSFRMVQEHEIEAWCNEGFVNDPKSKLFWGLVQSSSGACGVLASVQSFMIRSFLFNHSIYGELSFLLENKPPEEVVFVLKDLFLNYVSLRMPDFPPEFLYIIPLVESCCHVLYSVTDSSVYNVILLANSTDSGDNPSSLLWQSPYSARTFDNINSVANYLVENFRTLAGPLGVISLVLSVLATRTLDRVKEDMDDPSQPLIASYGHCSQELVNLFLHGRAVSNVFNGDKIIDEGSPHSMRLKGIASQCTVGFLTDLEALRLYKVGSFYKNPLVPIWVVSSFNHYTVLFGLDGGPCFISQSDILEQNLSEAWTQIDREDNKYIEVNSLGSLLDLLGLKHLLKDAVSSIEMVSGLVLWTNMLAWYKSTMEHNSQSQGEALGKMTLFHYNMKENKTPLLKLTVERTDELVLESTPSNDIDAAIMGTFSEGHKDVAKIVWSRWPRTSVQCQTLAAP